jgi:hypothetical protein
MFSEELSGRCCNRFTLNMKSLTERYCFLSNVPLFDFTEPFLISFSISAAGGWPRADE